MLFSILVMNWHCIAVLPQKSFRFWLLVALVYSAHRWLRFQTESEPTVHFSSRSKIYNPGVPRYHNSDHRSPPSGSNTFRTEVLWHRLNGGQPEEHDLQIVLVFNIFCNVFVMFSSLYEVLLLIYKVQKLISN